MPEFVPDENETIAAKHSARIARKLFERRHSKHRVHSWWNTWLFEYCALFSLVGLNLYTIYDIFGTRAPEIPYSGPVVPLFAKFVTLFQVDLAYTYQIVNIVFYLVLPLTLYYFVRKVTERKFPAFITVLVASLPFYPFTEVRAHAAFYGGDAPHIVSLAVLPMALSGVLLFVRRGGLKSFFVASVVAAFIALVSAFGYMNFVIFAALICFSEMLLGNGRLKILRLLAVIVASAALCSFWYNPGLLNWMIFGPFGEDVRGTIKRLIPISFFSLPVLATFGYILFDRKPSLQPVFLASFFTIIFAIISLTGGGVFPGSPSRYVAEFGLSLAFLISVVIVKLADYLRLVKHPALSASKRLVLANLMLVLILGTLIAGIVFGKENIFLNKDRVLGIWTDVERGEIWAKRDSFGMVSSVIGYLITSISLVGFGYLGKNIQNENSKTKQISSTA